MYKNLGLSPTLWPVKFLTCNKVSTLTNQTPTLTVLPCALIISLKNYQGHTWKTRARWRNGLARLQQWSCNLQEPGFESHLWQVEFFSCNKVSSLNNWIPTLTSVPVTQLSSPRLSVVACKTNKRTKQTYGFAISCTDGIVFPCSRYLVYLIKFT